MSVLDDLRAAVGAAQVLVGDDGAPYEVDWRHRFHGRALAVVRPGSTAEVAAVVRACRAHGTAIVTQGGNTGLVGGSVPDASGRQVVLSTARLNRIRSVDAANLALVAEAGCVLQRVQEAAADHANDRIRGAAFDKGVFGFLGSRGIVAIGVVACPYRIRVGVRRAAAAEGDTRITYRLRWRSQVTCYDWHRQRRNHRLWPS